MPTLDFDIRWRPFQLNAQAPEGKGVNELDMYKKVWSRSCSCMVPRMESVVKSIILTFHMVVMLVIRLIHIG